jgi:hypothetical protein
LDEARAELARLEASDTNAVGAAGLLKTNVASLQRDLEAAQRSRDAVLLWLVQEDVDSTIPKSWPVEIVDLAETPTRPVRSGVRSGASLMGIGLVFVLAGTFLRREDAGLPGGG